MARIYVSSTYKDLTDYREVVYRTLRQLQHDVIAMEDYVATDARPLDKCLQDVAGCDLYVGIFAFIYGYVPDDGNPEHKSITELEYRKAGEVGISRLVFIVKEGTAWPTNLLDAIVSEDHGRRIDEFRSELKKEHTDSFFESPEELARKVSVAVQQELARMRSEKPQIDSATLRRFLTGIVGKTADLPEAYRGTAKPRFCPPPFDGRTPVVHTVSARVDRRWTWHRKINACESPGVRACAEMA